MVFAANGATVVDGIVLGVRFRHAERAAEAAAYLSWFRRHEYPAVHEARHVNEGEGDILVAGDTLLAGYGFRSDFEAAQELAAVFGRRVLSLRLADPRFYHLDTALCVLDATTAMYYPAAFDDAGRAVLASVFDELIEAKDEDAEVLGLNAVSDGRHVVLARQATGLARALAARGFEPVPVDMSELLKAGGGAKCCTLELRSGVMTHTMDLSSAGGAVRAYRRIQRAQLPSAARRRGYGGGLLGDRRRRAGGTWTCSPGTRR